MLGIGPYPRTTASCAYVGGSVRIFPALPHEGGDLAAGHLKGDQVYCSWHNLAIESENWAESLPVFSGD